MISVLLPAYNAGRYLRESIESILAQTHRELELLVIDDGSTDGSVEDARRVISDPRVRWRSQENAGKSTALNWALGEMRGDYYAIQDGDDVSHPRRLELLAAALDEHPDVAAVFSGYELILNDRRVAPKGRAKSREDCRRDIDALRMPSHDPTGMYRASMVRDLRYATDLPIGQGYDYILRVGERAPMLVIPDCLYSYRVHVTSNTKRSPARRAEMVREVQRRALERRGLDASRLPPAAAKSARVRNRDVDNNLAAHFMDSARDLRAAGRWAEAVSVGLACARLHPLDPYYYRALGYALLPTALASRLSGRRADQAARECAPSPAELRQARGGAG